MENQRTGDAAKLATFGRRKVTPRVCIADGKQHIRVFLGETLEELGFTTRECMQPSQLGAVLDEQGPDLILLGLSAGAVEAGETLRRIRGQGIRRRDPAARSPRFIRRTAVRTLGQHLGIQRYPRSATPFGTEALRDSVAALLPSESPPSPPVDAAEATSAGWLELWYQPKIDTQTLPCATPRRSFASVTRRGGSSRRHTSFRTTVIPTCTRCRSS